MNASSAVYIRVSTQEQRTDSQEQELRRYCRQRGWKGLRVYVDKISGAKTSRPELEHLMQNIRAGAIERLVVYKLDRLGRSLTHLALILDELNRLQVPLIARAEEVGKLKAQGMGIRAIARQLAMARSSVSKALKRIGQPIKAYSTSWLS